MARANEPVPVLIVDADPAQRRLLSSHLDRSVGRRFRPVVCGSVAEAVAAMAGADGSMLIADLESIGGTAALTAFAGSGHPLIATSSRGSLTTAVEAMRAGASDFIAKPIGAKALLERLEAAMAAALHRPAAKPPAATVAGPDFEGFVGASPAMRKVYADIERIAVSRAPVFLTGESGTGKEVCAEAIHRRGGADRPFIAINCAAIPRDLLESEMFGHARGAFTGATEDRTGAAELAHGGTLFLDEIGEMALPLQAKLLRFIQTGTILRVGDARVRTVDVRFICATNRDPRAETAAGRFREDLYYRLNVLPLRLPPLAARPEDILPLAEHFLLRYAAEEGSGLTGFDAEAEALLRAHPWPGNVRQLQNLVRRIAVLHAGPVVGGPDLAEALAEFDLARPASAAAIPASPQGDRVRPFHQQERDIIEGAVAAFGGNISRAAAALQINPSTIYRKRQSWGLEA